MHLICHNSYKKMCDYVIQDCKRLRLFSHDSKVHNLNFNSKCAFWIKIWKTVVWTVCTPKCVIWNAQFKWWSGPSFELRISNYESWCDLAYTRSKIPSFESSFELRISNYKSWCDLAYTRSKIPSFESSFELRISNYASRCDFGVHMVQTTVFWILIQNAHFKFKFKFKLRTLLSCENSQCNATLSISDILLLWENWKEVLLCCVTYSHCSLLCTMYSLSTSAGIDNLHVSVVFCLFVFCSLFLSKEGYVPIIQHINKILYLSIEHTIHLTAYMRLYSSVDRTGLVL